MKVLLKFQNKKFCYPLPKHSFQRQRWNCKPRNFMAKWASSQHMYSPTVSGVRIGFWQKSLKSVLCNARRGMHADCQRNSEGYGFLKGGVWEPSPRNFGSRGLLVVHSNAFFGHFTQIPIPPTP